MTDLMRYAADLEGLSPSSPAPVDQWNPSRSGKIDITILRDGVWFHEGAPIERARLVRLFSTVLKREKGEYYLVTPHEKLKITVEDAPFTAVLLTAEGVEEKQTLTFTTNIGDKVIAGPENGIYFKKRSGNSNVPPYLEVRHGLAARITRSVFYDLVGYCKTYEIDGVHHFGVWSEGEFFSFGRAEDIVAT
ncbi:DUF1285 domain-containing protein [Hyphococcus flavus]|uniref:DUF1285 domain-containing protein n=1 Tax=Hyphococcus flavus TaxID=1866326 RepID=A0AAF0CBA8_9PROT|nr:DUF1285 domain-containing protein [Hyphococcus flavus]WDI30445.1 DUF1285 domain-containing protein [Hyphococcus flavus]